MPSLEIFNWHTILMHFAIAFLLVSSILFFFMLRYKKNKQPIEVISKYIFLVGTLFALLATGAWFSIPVVMPVNGVDSASILSYERLGSITVVVAVLFSILIWISTHVRPSHVLGSWIVSILGVVVGIQGTQLSYANVADLQPVAVGHAGEPLFAPGVDEKDNTIPTVAAGTDSALEFVRVFQSAMHTEKFEFVSGAFDNEAIIFENGIKEPSLNAYLLTHLKPEMAVLAAAKRQVIYQNSSENNAKALVTTTSILTFSVKGKQHDFNSVETLGLIKKEGHWMIEHAHWSSRPVQK